MEYEEQFPILLARAACMHLSKQLQPIEPHLSSSPAAKQQSSDAPQGDIWQVQFAHHLQCPDILHLPEYFLACAVAITLSLL